MKIVAWIIGVPIGLLALLLIIGKLAGPPSEKSTERRTIERCWENQQKKSLTPEEQRFIAGACEKMEETFRAKHGTNP